jgi:hypothetical protein
VWKVQQVETKTKMFEGKFLCTYQNSIGLETFWIASRGILKSLTAHPAEQPT